MNQPYLSVVIPAYNEEVSIQQTLKEVTSYLQSQPYNWEVLVVDDGSVDATAALVKAFTQEHKATQLISVAHGGKGWAVKNGMLKAVGAYRFLCDADLSMPIEQVSRFLPPQITDYHIAVGSREAPGARRIGEPWTRHVMGRFFNTLVRFLAVSGVSDTQCGFKCFCGATAAKLFQSQKIYGFSFDVEILFLAQKLGLKIKEVPIDWYYRPQSKVRPLRDSFTMVRDIIRIRWYYLLGKYPQLSRSESAKEHTL